MDNARSALGFSTLLSVTLLTLCASPAQAGLMVYRPALLDAMAHRAGALPPGHAIKATVLDVQGHGQAAAALTFTVSRRAGDHCDASLRTEVANPRDTGKVKVTHYARVTRVRARCSGLVGSMAALYAGNHAAVQVALSGADRVAPSTTAHGTLVAQAPHAEAGQLRAVRHVPVVQQDGLRAPSVAPKLSLIPRAADKRPMPAPGAARRPATAPKAPAAHAQHIANARLEGRTLPRFALTITQRANLRAAPSFSAPKLSSLKAGTRLSGRLLMGNEGWYEVQDGSVRGYLHESVVAQGPLGGAEVAMVDNANGG